MVPALRAALALDGMFGPYPEFLLLEPLSRCDLVQWNGRKLAPVRDIQGRIIERQIAVKRLVDHSSEAMAGGYFRKQFGDEAWPLRMKELGLAAKFDVLNYLGGDVANGSPAEKVSGEDRESFGVEIRREVGVCAGVLYFAVEISR